MLLPVIALELMRYIVKQAANRLRLELAPRFAEGRSGDRLRGRQRQAGTLCFIPERVERVAVAAATAVGDEVEQERDEQVRLDRTTAREVSALLLQSRVRRTLEELSQH